MHEMVFCSLADEVLLAKMQPMEWVTALSEFCKYIQYGTCSMVHAVRYMQYGTCSMVHAVWYMQYGTCSMVHTVWYMQYGTCSMVHTVSLFQYTVYNIQCYCIQYTQYYDN